MGKVSRELTFKRGANNYRWLLIAEKSFKDTAVNRLLTPFEWPHNHTYIGYTNRTQELPLMTKRAEEMNLGGVGVKKQSWKEEVIDGCK